MKRLSFLLVLFTVLPSPALAERKPKISWETAVKSIEGKIEPAEAKPGQTVTCKLIVRLFPGHWTYPTRQTNPNEQSTRNVFVLPATGDLIFVEPITDPTDAHTKPSPLGGDMLYYPGGATWEFKAVVSPKATGGEKQVRVQLAQLLVCNDDACLPPGKVPIKQVTANVTVAGPPVPAEPKYQDAVAKAIGEASPLPPPKKGPTDPPTPSPKDPPRVAKDPPTPVPASEPKAVAHRLSASRDHAADLKAVLDQLPPPSSRDAGLWRFLATAVGFGIITLFTPCVFPMIPITVSIFLKQSQKEGTNPLAHALVYAVTIVVILSVAALTLLTTFSRLAVDPYTNVLLGLLFVVLALSLFGLFEITLPSSLANATTDRAGKGGYLGTVFMAVSFTIVSFTCVAPFLGGFSGMAASGNFSTLELALGALAFATAFASPFFLLALFPSLLKKLPKSGDWMNMIKVTMGFLELAAALKFFRTAELRWLTPPEYFTYDVVLALWVAILIAMAFYLLGVFKMKHDHEEHDHVGPFRILFALAALGLAVYLTPALFGNGARERNRPAGQVYAWVDAFLLPEPSAAEMVGSDLPWTGDLRRALDEARAKGGRVFVDFTGETCSNCKLNERNVFPKPEIKELLKQYTLAQLYTDTVPEIFYDSAPGLDRRNADGRANLEFEDKAFGQQQLPLYVILKPEPTGKTTVVGVYEEGKINDEPKLIDFLKNGLK
jgi:thiol:disulfide interchange protein